MAEVLGKRHDAVLRDIVNLLMDIDSLQNRGLIKTTYKPEKAKRSFPKYNLTKDGFTLLVMGFTGKKALQFKMMYINEFNRMEEELKNHLLLTLGYVKHT